MNKLKLILKNLLPSVLFLISFVFLLSLLSYFNILRGTALVIFEIIICFISIFIGSYNQGKSSLKRGYLEGMSIGGIYIFIFAILNLAFYNLFHIKNLIYYLLILIVSSLGGMIGISKKKK